MSTSALSAENPAIADPHPSTTGTNLFATLNLPRSVAFSRCPSLGEALSQYDVTDVLLRARLREARLTPALQLRCSDFPDPLLMLAVMDFEVPDTVGVLPIWQQMAQACPRAELRIIGDDEMPLLERMLNGDSPLDVENLELPLLLLLDEEFQLLAQWGPRPQAAEQFIEEWLAQHPDFERLAEDESAEGIDAFAALTLNLVRSTRIWYNSALDRESSLELERLLASLQGEVSESGGVPVAGNGNEPDDSAEL